MQLLDGAHKRLRVAGAGDADAAADEHGPGGADDAGAAAADAGDLDAEVAAIQAPDPDGDPGRGASPEEGPSSEEEEEEEEAGAARGARVGAKRSAALAGLPQGYADPRDNPTGAAAPELGEGVGWGDEDAGASGEGLGSRGPASGGAAAEAAAEAPLTKRQRKRQKAEQEARLRAAEQRQLEAPAPQSAAEFEKLVRALRALHLPHGLNVLLQDVTAIAKTHCKVAATLSCAWLPCVGKSPLA